MRAFVAGAIAAIGIAVVAAAVSNYAVDFSARTVYSSHNGSVRL